MAAAVYLHNALFSHTSLTPSQSQAQSNDQPPSESSSIEELEDTQDDTIIHEDHATIERDDYDEQTTRADISTPLPSLSANVNANVDVDVDAHAHVQYARQTTGNDDREHTRKSSETTLVSLLSPLWNRSRTREREPLAPTNFNTPQENVIVSSEQAHAYGQAGNLHPTEDVYPEGYVDIPLTTASEAPNNPDSTPNTPNRHSPLPPGLPPHTSSTSRRQPTPYPFPNISHPSSHFRDSSTSAVDTHRTRPKGRRRPPATLDTSTDNFRNSPIVRFIRKGRVLNQSLSRSTRIIILIGRGFLTAILCGWAAYSCARYWLAYSGQFTHISPSYPISPSRRISLRSHLWPLGSFRPISPL